MVALDAAHEEMVRLSGLIDQGITALREQSRQFAETERTYRLAKARAWLEAPRATVPEREAWVNAKVADERRDRDVAEGLRQSALEAVRSRRGQLSAWQSYLAANREEASFARTGPEWTP